MKSNKEEMKFVGVTNGKSFFKSDAGKYYSLPREIVDLDKGERAICEKVKGQSGYGLLSVAYV